MTERANHTEPHLASETDASSKTPDAEKPPYTLTIDLNALNHLGFNLYSNIPAVLSEVIANCWDADAEHVDIQIEPGANLVTILDDGVGMTKIDINKKYLTVGYQKRKTASRTNKGRHVMGRKGIGKLSLFSIANTIEVQSACKTPEGIERNGFRMVGFEIEQKIASGAHDYQPTPITPEKLPSDTGTKILVSDLKLQITQATIKSLRTRIARRFSIIGNEFDFEVKINGVAINVTDRNYLDSLEYAWAIGTDDDKNRLAKLAKNAKRTNKIDGQISNQHHITGWVGTVDERKKLDDADNSIVVLAWGKLVQEDILKPIGKGGLFTKYVIGEIHADFLDLDEEPDIATSDRQRLKEDDPRYAALREFVKTKILNTIENRWRDWRHEDASERALENPAIQKWFAQLSATHKRYAKQLFGKIESFPIEDEQYKEELYRHGILAFEKLALKDSLATLEKVENEHDFNILAEVFGSIDDIEAAQYHGIIRGRLEIIRKFENLVPASREKVIQEYLFDHLWLLHPSWERASTNPHIEQAVTAEFKNVSDGLTKEERKGRIDIRYKTAAGKHIIIELKRYTVKISATDLANQLRKYRSALSKCLAARFPGAARNIELIAILGQPPEPADEPEQNEKILAAINARYITYDTLIEQTLADYKEYLDANKQISALQEILRALGDS